MGWHINLVTNEVVINKKIAQELFDKVGRWDFGDPVSESDIMDFGVAYTERDGTLRLYFNSDDMEHMDFVWEDRVQAVLRKHKVKGDICFSSDDGDNAGESWGYRFDGKGGMTKLVGSRTFVEVAPAESKRPKKARVSKKAAKGKKRKPKQIIVCAGCYDSSSPDEKNQVGYRPGTYIIKEGSHELYCYDCGDTDLKEL